MAKKRATVGERILMRCYGASIVELRTEPPWSREVKYIDAAIRRAARDGWNYGRDYEEQVNSETNYSPEAAGKIRAHLEKKYGVKFKS